MKKLLLWIPLVLLLTILLSGCPALFNALGGGPPDDFDPQADLAVGAIEFSVDTSTGSVTGVEFIITNNGDAPALNAEYRVVVSSNQIVGTNSSDDITVFQDTITVDAGDQETVALTTQIQQYINSNGVSLNPANYYVGVILDPGEDIDESNEQNNTGVSSSTGFIGGASDGGGGGGTGDVDLMVNSVAFNLDQQQELVESVTMAFANTGSADANDVEFRFFLSVDESPDLQDTRVYAGAVNVPANGTQTVVVTFDEIATYIQTNNISYADGTYYGIAGIDPGNNVAETNEDNNFEVTSGTQFLSGPGGSGGTTTDLKIESVVYQLDQQSNVTGIEVAIENAGTADVADVGYEVYLSSDATLGQGDIPVYASSISSDAGTVDYVTVTLDEINTYLQSQSTSVPDGEYYAGARVDPGNAIAETDETNNGGVSPTTATFTTTGGTATISLLSGLQNVTGAATPGNAVAVDLGVQYQDATSDISDELYYTYSVVPGAPYEFFVDDAFSGSGTYAGDVDVTLYYDAGSGDFITYSGTTGANFDSPYPDVASPETAKFVASPAEQQVIRIRPYGASDPGFVGSFGFGMIADGPYGWADFVTATDIGFGGQTIDLSEGVMTAIEEETEYTVQAMQDTVHTLFLDAPLGSQGDFSQERFVRVWITDSIVDSSNYARDVEVAVLYSTASVTDAQLTNLTGGVLTQSLDKFDSSRDAPGVFRLPDGVTALKLEVSTWNTGDPIVGSSTGENLYGFAFDYYGSDVGGGN